MISSASSYFASQQKGVVIWHYEIPSPHHQILHIFKKKAKYHCIPFFDAGNLISIKISSIKQVES